LIFYLNKENGIKPL